MNKFKHMFMTEKSSNVSRTKLQINIQSNTYTYYISAKQFRRKTFIKRSESG